MKKKQTITNDWWLERKNRDMWRSCSGEWQNEWPAQSMYSAKCMPLQSNPTDTMFTETGKIKLIIQTLCQPYENTLHRVKMMYYSTNKFIKWDHNKTALYILGTTVHIFYLQTSTTACISNGSFHFDAPVTGHMCQYFCIATAHEF